MRIFDFFINDDKNKPFYAQVVTTNSFALNQDKSLQIYFFLVKQAKKKKKKKKKKNDFLKNVESTVVCSHSFLYFK